MSSTHHFVHVLVPSTDAQEALGSAQSFLFDMLDPKRPQAGVKPLGVYDMKGRIGLESGPKTPAKLTTEAERILGEIRQFHRDRPDLNRTQALHRYFRENLFAWCGGIPGQGDEIRIGGATPQEAVAALGRMLTLASTHLVGHPLDIDVAKAARRMGWLMVEFLEQPFSFPFLETRTSEALENCRAFVMEGGEDLPDEWTLVLLAVDTHR